MGLTTLIVALVLAAGPHLPPNLDLAGGGVSSPKGIVDMTYPGAGEPAGIPPPTVELNPADFKPGDTTWVDRRGGVTFTKSGAPLAWQGSPFYPEGFAEALHPGAYIDSGNRYNFPTASDPMDVGAFTVVEVISGADLGLVEHEVYRNGTYAANGTEAWHSGTSFNVYVQTSTGPQGVSQTGVMNSGTVVRCWGADIPNHLMVSNVNGTEASNTSVTGTYVSGAVNTAVLGNSAYPAKSNLHEFMFSTVPVTVARCRTLIQQVMSCRTHPCVPDDAGTVSHVTFSASGVLSDSQGHAWVKTGSPVASSPVYLWPGLRTPLAQPSVSFGGVSDYFTGTGTGMFGGDFVATFAIAPTLSAGRLIFASGAYNSDGCGFRVNAAGTVAAMCQGSDGVQILTTVGAVTSGTWNVIVAARVGAIIYVNINGTEESATNTGTAIASTHAPVVGGGSAGFSGFFSGKMALVDVRNGATTVAERDRIVRHRMGLMAIKPATNTIPLTRNDVHPACCPVTDAACFALGPNFPCITSKGLERAGATSNMLASAIVSAWAADGSAGRAPTVTANGCADPVGGQTGTLVAFAATDAGDQYSRVFTSLTGATVAVHNASIFARTTSGSGTLYTTLVAASTVTQANSLTTSFSRISQTHTLHTGTSYVEIGPFPARSPQPYTQPALTVCLWAGQLTLGAYLQPPRLSTGTPYSGPATVAYTANVLTNPSRWAYSVTATPFGSWSAVDSLLLSVGIYGQGNGVGARLYTDGKVYLDANDSAGNLNRVTALHGFTSGSTHTVVAQSAAPTSMRLFYDDVRQTTGDLYTGLGVTAMQSNLWIGSASGGGTVGGIETFPGYIKRLVQCNDKRGCR